MDSKSIEQAAREWLRTQRNAGNGVMNDHDDDEFHAQYFAAFHEFMLKQEEATAAPVGQGDMDQIISFEDVVHIHRREEMAMTIDAGRMPVYHYWFEIDGVRSPEMPQWQYDIQVNPWFERMFNAIVPAIRARFQAKWQSQQSGTGEQSRTKDADLIQMLVDALEGTKKDPNWWRGHPAEDWIPEALAAARSAGFTPSE